MERKNALAGLLWEVLFFFGVGFFFFSFSLVVFWGGFFGAEEFADCAAANARRTNSSSPGDGAIFAMALRLS